MVSFVELSTASFISSHNSFGESFLSSLRSTQFVAYIDCVLLKNIVNIISYWWCHSRFCLEFQLQACNQQLMVTPSLCLVWSKQLAMKNATFFSLGGNLSGFLRCPQGFFISKVCGDAAGQECFQSPGRLLDKNPPSCHHVRFSLPLRTFQF